jgi:hypothetical protein
MDTSGPLNTDGSFMSFHVYSVDVLPSYTDGSKFEAHHERTTGLHDRREANTTCQLTVPSAPDNMKGDGGANHEE